MYKDRNKIAINHFLYHNIHQLPYYLTGVYNTHLFPCRILSRAYVARLSVFTFADYFSRANNLTSDCQEISIETFASSTVYSFDRPKKEAEKRWKRDGGAMAGMHVRETWTLTGEERGEKGRGGWIMGRYFDTPSCATPGSGWWNEGAKLEKGERWAQVWLRNGRERGYDRWSRRQGPCKAVRGRRGKNGERADPCVIYIHNFNTN